MQITSRSKVLMVGAVTTLSIAFLFRVAGQVIQRWFPVEFLPPFEAWQGSGLPYPVLLACQVAILAVLAAAIRGMVRRRQALGTKASRCVMVIGFAYFATMAGRLILGLTVFDDNRWFIAWISTALHLDLSAIAILWSWDQFCGSRNGDV